MKRVFGIAAALILGMSVIACSHNREIPTQLTAKPDSTPAITATVVGGASIRVTATVGEVATLGPTLSDEIINPTNTITPEPTVVQELANSTKYNLKIDLDYQKLTANVAELVEFRNPSDKPLNQLVFIVEPNRYPNGFEIQQVTTIDSPTKLMYSIESNLLKLDLDPALPADELIKLSFNFRLVLPAIPPPSDQYKPQPYGYTSKQVNIVDWYLFLPPLSQAGDWLVHKPSYFGEYLVYPQADFQVELNLINASSDVIVAASAKNLVAENGGYEYELKAARSFSLSLSSYYQVSEMVVDGVNVISYYFGIEQAAGEEALNATAGALKLYSEVYGPYPHDTMTVVEADFLDGMEYDGLYFLSNGFYNLYDGSPKGYLTIIAVHETAHQWFYGRVGNDQALEPWLDESFCTFSELLYYEKMYPELVDWWWYYRVNFYEPVGMINLPVYDYTGFTPYRNAVYLRGAEFLYELRAAIGSDLFTTTLQKYVTDYSGKIATTQDFMREFGLDGGAQQELLSKYFK